MHKTVANGFVKVRSTFCGIKFPQISKFCQSKQNRSKSLRINSSTDENAMT